MNTFGRFFRVQIFGESHGPVVGLVIEGCPAGLSLVEEDFQQDLERRKGGIDGTTARVEADRPLLMSGMFEGRTTGGPLHICFANGDKNPAAYEEFRYAPRPGHADFTAQKKFGGFNDFRGGGQFSGRLTVALVAAGVVAKKLIHPAEVRARLLEVGGSGDVENTVRHAMEWRDSVGGLVECVAQGVPVGLGEPFFDSVESLVSHMMFAIPGIKGIEFGSGFAAARMRGSAHNDAILTPDGVTATNFAGGVNGGITNGNDIVFRVAVKPTPSIGRHQLTVDMRTGSTIPIVVEGRHDTCIALRVPVIAEAATAVVLADLMFMEQRIPRIRE